MEINQDYMHFKRWYKDTESAIHCGQWDDEQIAYAAYCEGMKRVKNCNKPAVSNLMPELEKIVSSRIKDAFDNGMQNYEKNEIQAALDTIKRLVPPSYFEGICC